MKAFQGIKIKKSGLLKKKMSVIVDNRVSSSRGLLWRSWGHQALVQVEKVVGLCREDRIPDELM